MRRQRIERLVEADEIARDQLRALMDQLVISVLAVRARRAPNNRSRLIAHTVAIQIDALAVALHVELFKVGGQTTEIMIVRQNRDRLSAEKIVVPDANQSQE